jgi:glycosyltransferase involved in cell wall biosynthesis
MVIDGETGVLVPSRDPAALADGIVRMIDNRALRMRMGTAARLRAAMSFSIEAHGARLQNVYDAACAPLVRFKSRTEAA